MHQSHTLDVGLDVHQASSAVASVANAYGAEVVLRGAIGTRQCDIDALIRTRHAKSQPLVLSDEAGPCGDWLYRALAKQGDGGWVVAPSLLPPKAGDRVNTDRRDAVPRARLLRSGALTPVDVPSRDDAARRDRTRAREEARRDLKPATFRLNAVLLRQDMRDTG